MASDATLVACITTEADGPLIRAYFSMTGRDEDRFEVSAFHVGVFEDNPGFFDMWKGMLVTAIQKLVEKQGGMVTHVTEDLQPFPKPPAGEIH